jgi:recombinational DNA repair ATPase RecF
MSLLALEAEGLRCLKPSRLEFHTHVNLVTGANGAGKTSLLAPATRNG